MPPRRAAAIKADQANASQSQSQTDAKPASSKAKKPASAKPNSKKRVASPEQEEEDEADEEEEEEEVKPKKKKAKTSKSTDDTKVDDPPPKIATMTRRGTAVPVDGRSGKVGKFTWETACFYERSLGSSHEVTHEVLVDGSETYDGMLNQADIGKNANKYVNFQRPDLKCLTS